MTFAHIYTGILIIISIVIQGHSSFDVLRIAGVKPDILFIVVIYLAYNFGSFYGEVTGFISGIIHDSVSNSPLGLLTFPKMALGFIAGMFGRSVLKSNIITIILLIFSASIIKGVFVLLLSYIFHQPAISSSLNVILPEAFYNAFLAPSLFFIFDKIYHDELMREGSM